MANTLPSFKTPLKKVGGFSFKLVFLLLLGLLFFESCNRNKESTRPTIQDLTESVYSSVIIQPDSLYAVYSSTGGIVNQILVEEGDMVRIGDPLFKVKDSSANLNIENTRIALELAQSNFEGKASVLKELEIELGIAAMQLKNDSINYHRQKRLWANKVGTALEYDNRKLAYEVSSKHFGVLKNKLDRTKKELKSQIRQAEVNYKNSQVIGNEHTVRSMLAGKVYEVLKNPGEVVSMQEPIAYIGSQNKFRIEMAVDEVDIVKIRMGQKLILVLDAYQDTAFEGTVSKITPRMDSRSQTFIVEGSFIAPPEVLYAGLTGEANIIISERERVLTIPLNYLASPQSVQTKEGDVPVRTGIRNLEWVEILSGIDTNTVLIKPE